MDNTDKTTDRSVNFNKITHSIQLEEDEEFSDDFLDDEPIRKPKGKKIKKMRTSYDK